MKTQQANNAANTSVNSPSSPFTPSSPPDEQQNFLNNNNNKAKIMPAIQDQLKKTLSNSGGVTPTAEEYALEVKADVTPVTLTFKDLSYSVQVKSSDKNVAKNGKKDILKGLTGICKPGELTAIMGSSGAGKTTLLNILSVRTSSTSKNTLSGEFLANGNKYDLGKFSKFAGYVMQNDILLETMTPREIFQFVADLRLSLNKEEKAKRVSELLRDLRLDRAADTFVGGNFLKGISGGERKRTSIGVELMTDPNLLFLDEPTSGLDSFTAFLLITLLKSLALKQRKTVIFTIHQPSSDTFFLFDKLMLLAKGKFIYQGPTMAAVDHFATIGYKCPEYTNPADYFIEVAHASGDDDPKFERMYNAYDSKIALPISQEVVATKTTKLSLAGKHAGSFEAFGYIARRGLTNMLRNPLLFKGRIGQTFFMCFLICCVFFKVSTTVDNDGLGNSAQNDSVIKAQIVRNINGCLFFFIISQFMANAMSIVLTFPAERANFLREYSANMYSVSTYYFGRSVIELPFLLIFPFIMAAICYFIIGLNSDAGRFFLFSLILILVALAGNAVGLWVGCLFSDSKVASNVMPAFILPFMLFAGFYINVSSMHDWLGWIQWISPFRYALEAFMWNEYGDSQFGTIQVTSFGFDVGKWQCVAILFALGLALRMAALGSLKLLVRKLE